MAAATALLAECERVKVSLVPSGVMGTDGTFYTLRVSRGWSRVVLEWWAETPRPSRTLDRILKTFVALAGDPWGHVNFDAIGRYE